MGFIANDFTFPSQVRRGSAIRNNGLIETIDILQDNTLLVHTVEGVVKYEESALRGIPNYSIQSVTPVISHFGAYPHLVLVIHGFDMGTSDTRRIIVSTSYPVAE